jgi:mannosyltransferase OCH1-like enzyme
LNVPVGTILRNANEILSRSKIFQYQHQASYAGFSNFFRYKLLLERGGWWADTDLVCIRPFDFPEPHVFGSEICDEREVVTSGIIKAPAGSAAMAYAWSVCQSKDPAKLTWGETGPKLVAEVVDKYSLQGYVKPHQIFCPFAYDDWREILKPQSGKFSFETSYAVHLWNEMWRAAGQNKDAAYDPKCPYEQLKQRYL